MITIMMMTLLSMLIMWMKHPLSLGLILLTQTINLSLFMGYFNLNYWYSYILFLIMIGGMLVLFIYMTSVASNEKFFPSIKLSILSMLILIWYTILFLFTDSYYLMMNSNLKNNNLNFNWSLNKYFNYPNLYIMYLLIIYLLITLIVVVKITNFKKGSLRT
uniref:NADH-ubiquinone oxidoreductase chain 6 n=1 Tax=Cleptocaccobius convexifrons TaxID=206826 RepID=A0A1X9HDB7_9SCAR|nr:NADH deshydrogenase subunit 6 [Cleptocaccobius convexifrons]